MNYLVVDFRFEGSRTDADRRGELHKVLNEYATMSWELDRVLGSETSEAAGFQPGTLVLIFQKLRDVIYER